ncbi:hypothetical protein QP405_09465 [Gleimia europaea]|uniref:hypothetical protein n=1 Tax=Gleimia europaea TaxID=66228 RepID=UPI00265A75BF|nr:hypothetical protein [Gleimia europaea]MDK7144078.1 hypothetical protein [Gleimia europaea]
MAPTPGQMSTPRCPDTQGLFGGSNRRPTGMGGATGICQEITTEGSYPLCEAPDTLLVREYVPSTV